MKSEEHLKKLKAIHEVLAAHGIQIHDVIPTSVGPSFSQFRVTPLPGKNLSRVRLYADDIAMALGTAGVRVSLRPDSLVIEIPNDERSTVPLRALLESGAFADSRTKLPLALGQGADGSVRVLDLTEAPHILVGGAAGTGKTVCLRAMMASLLAAKKEEELKLLLIAPKMTAKGVVSNVSDAADALDRLCAEMEARYERLQHPGQMPYIVCFIDEWADLVLAAEGQDVTGERIPNAVIRLMQRGRAVGIHLIMSTQRPSPDVLSSLIKVNIPTRIALHTCTRADSEAILGIPGAERLMEDGDMLLADGNEPLRLQGAYVSEAEIKISDGHLW